MCSLFPLYQKVQYEYKSCGLTDLMRQIVGPKVFIYPSVKEDGGPQGCGANTEDFMVGALRYCVPGSFPAVVTQNGLCLRTSSTHAAKVRTKCRESTKVPCSSTADFVSGRSPRTKRC